MRKKLKILIVDDHAVVREGLKRIIGDTPNLDVMYEASNGDDALKLIKSKKIDLPNIRNNKIINKIFKNYFVKSFIFIN